MAVPLGIALAPARERRAAQPRGLAMLQTIPSLALLAFMIPLLGLGVSAAVAALFLYALLPILRNTCVGIAGVDPDLIEAARGMGMREGQILRLVRLPLAMHTILAGVRTATVISVGVATLAAFIGAGGLGEPMVTGLYLDNTALILCGAVPAAILAVLADAALGLVERALAPRTSSAP
ncbi:MAG: ABC transporter permease [Planctomycetota bacterium]